MDNHIWSLHIGDRMKPTSEINKQINIQELLKDLAFGIDGVLRDNLGEMGFALVIFEFNTLGVGNYISNAKREDMIVALRELADRLEANQDLPPTVNPTIQ
jgi:hypothetical protein